MDTSFDLVALLKQQPTTTQSHKIRPTQFVSVARGIQKRLETNIKNRKSSRSSIFDSIRNITRCNSPRPLELSEAQQKALYRKQQLEKWKEEKDKKKKEAAAQKRKPFVAGMSQRKTFGPPPPLLKPVPSTSGRVTRSQAQKKIEPQPSSTHTKSFAPSNATFKPSLFLNTKVPTLAAMNKKKATKPKPNNITFEPVLPKNLQKEAKTTRTTRAKPVANKPVIEMKHPIEKTKAKITQKPPPLKQQMFQCSSSSSDMDQPSKIKRKQALRKETSKTQEKPVPVVRHESVYEQATTSTSSQDSQDACMSQDTTSMSEDVETMSEIDGWRMEKISTPRNKVPKSESSSEEKLRSPNAVDVPLTAEQIAEEAKNISPCVTMSRGKDNARKEMMKKMDEGLFDEDNSKMESVNHFRRQLNSEIARITARCDTWDQIYAQTVLPEPIQELVLAAVGQARLLMSKKLQQFAGLVEKCACPTPGTAIVTPTDLHGFWDMVFMQVENVDLRFNDLEALRLRDWIEEQKPVDKKVAKPLVAAKKAAAKPTGGPSRLKQMIAAARRANKESQSENSGSEKSEATQSPETKIFEAGFFRISSPLKRGSPAPATPSNKSSLLKIVLSSEAKKSVSKNSTSFAMLRASMMSKNVDIEGVTPLMQTPTIAPVNLNATPARSILKQNNAVSAKKTEKLKTVLFHEDEEPKEPSSPTFYESCVMSEPGLTPLPADDKENEATPKPATSNKSSSVKTEENVVKMLCRQNAVEQSSPVTTRGRCKGPHTPADSGNVETTRRTRKSAQTPLVDSDNVQKKRSTRKSVQTPLVETDENVQNKRSTRKSAQTSLVEADENVQNKRSTRKSAQTPLVEADENVQNKRSTRKSAQTPLVEADDNVQNKRSTRKSAQTPLLEADDNVPKKRSTRKSAQRHL